MKKVLEVIKATKRFGGLTANADVSFDAFEGEILGIVGPNGAGKTTLFNAISGVSPATSGQIIFDGKDITKTSAYEICKMGIGRTFQIPLSIDELSVFDNVLVGSFCHTDNVSVAREKAFESLKFCGLDKQANMKAGQLNIAQKKRLEICRALATDPKLLLLDETMAGLSSTGREEAIEFIYNINKRGITIITIEHIMEVIMRISQRIVVLNSGSLLMIGTPSEVASDEKVLEVYLGGD